MSKSIQFNALTHNSGVDSAAGIIYGVCVMSAGEAKGHGLFLDLESLDSFMELTKSRPNGIGTRFGADHDAGAEDFNGTLKEFRLDGDKIRADLHLLKTDKNFAKLIEMAQTMPHEFGLSASTQAEEVIKGKEKYVRFKEIFCVDVVTNPAATKGLFFSQPTNNNQTTMLKEFALYLGLAENATEDEIKIALEAKKKLDAEAKCKKQEQDADAEAECEDDADAKAKCEADDEEKGKDKKKKFESEIEALKLQVGELVNAANAAKESAHKAEIENLKLEASKEGKVISLSDEAILKLSVAEVKDMIAKLPKGQIKMSKGNVNVDSKPSFDLESARQKKAAGALALGQAMKNQLTLNK